MAVLAVLCIHKPCWVDECHFVESIKLYKTNFSLSTLVNYNEMAPPLCFMLYAAWGRLLGDSLISLRLFSIIIAMSTYYAFYYLFGKVLDYRKAAWLTVFLALNPYMAGSSIFVYTDMPAMFFLAVLCIAMTNRSPLLCFIGAAGGLLCRQYFAFAVAAAFCWSLLNFLNTKQRLDLVNAGTLVLASIPLFALFVLWKGFCPVSFYRKLLLTEHVTFHLNSVTLYVIQIFIYLLPVICLRIKSLYANRRWLIISALLCWGYWLFPVTASAPAVDVGKPTVGLFHRLLRIWPGETKEQWVFFICFALALPVVLSILSDTWQRIKSRDYSYLLFIDFSIIAFFLVMPFSYMHWEKYFIPLLPIAAMQLLLAGGNRGKPTG